MIKTSIRGIEAYELSSIHPANAGLLERLASLSTQLRQAREGVRIPAGEVRPLLVRRAVSPVREQHRKVAGVLGSNLGSREP